MVQDEAFNATPRDLDRTFEDVLVQKCRKLYSLLTGTVSKTVSIIYITYNCARVNRNNTTRFCFP